jgi:beta-mannosidase
MFQFMFMDCWPSVTWAVVEYDRTPKQAYFTLQQVYQPVLIGADLERERLLIGTDRGGHPRPFMLSPWVVNDGAAALRGCTYRVQLEGPGGAQDIAGSEPFDVPADGVLQHAPVVEVAPPPPGLYTLRLALICDGQELSGNSYELTFEALPVDAMDTSL